MMQGLTYELGVLAKAVQHKNLSAAAVHVGLSQPQLSRLVAKVEQGLNVVLLDRTARRKSGWTPFAHDLAVAFSRGMGRLEAEIAALATDIEVSEVRIGTLEGLSTIASAFASSCFQDLGMRVVYLDVLDFADLDAEFIGQNLDFIFTVRSPGKQKFHNLIDVGYQQLERIHSDRATLVASGFEFAGVDKKSLDGCKHALVSNSLDVRRHWLKEIGGVGVLPSDAKTGRGKGQYTISLIGSELLSPKLWEKVKKLY